MLGNGSLCALCRTPTKLRCSLCRAVYYCTAECQTKHWKDSHRQECTRGAARKPVVAAPKKEPEKREHALCASDGTLAKPKKVLFPYKVFLSFFNSNIVKVPCGLINCGNSCYANAVLQCLAFTRPLAAYLLQGLHQEACQREDWCFMCELEDHVQRAFSNPMPFSPTKILSRLRSIGNSLGYGRQEDAHEFMRLAVDCMQKICLDEAGGETSLDARTQETTLIQHIFGGYLQSQVICCQCQQESNLYENMLDLSVGIQGNVESLEDALKQFTSAELLDGENKYRCDRCNAYVRAKKRLAVHEAPNILTIALKRFQGGKFGKINKKVTFPEELDMLPYMSGKADVPPLYKLYAVVVHVDMLNASYFGHYVCFVKAGNGTWFKIDDSKVKEFDLEKVMTQRAYMLFYRRSEPRPRPVVEDVAATSSTTSDSAVMETSCCRNDLTAGETTSISRVQQFTGTGIKGLKDMALVGSAGASSSREDHQRQVLESSDSSIESAFPNSVTNAGAQRTLCGMKRRWKQEEEADEALAGPSSSTLTQHEQGHASSSSCNTFQAHSSPGLFTAVTESGSGTFFASTSGSLDREVDGLDMECSLPHSSVTLDVGSGGLGPVGFNSKRLRVAPRQAFFDVTQDEDDSDILLPFRSQVGVCDDVFPAPSFAGVSDTSSTLTAGQPMLKRGFLNDPA